MEMTEKYLDGITLVADFWVVDKSNEVLSFQNEGISIEKSNTYLNKYNINILLKKEDYGKLDFFAKGWESKFPKVLITKASKKMDVYELKFKKAVEKGPITVLECVGELMK